MIRPHVMVLLRWGDDAIKTAVADALGIASQDLTDLAIIATSPSRVVVDLIERLPGAARAEVDSTPPGWTDLTDRERIVASMAGRGLTDQQIANRLRITTNTVNYHLRHIYRKLSIRSRVCLARLLPPEPAPPPDPPR